MKAKKAERFALGRDEQSTDAYQDSENHLAALIAFHCILRSVDNSDWQDRKVCNVEEPNSAEEAIF